MAIVIQLYKCAVCQKVVCYDIEYLCNLLGNRLVLFVNMSVIDLFLLNTCDYCLCMYLENTLKWLCVLMNLKLLFHFINIYIHDSVLFIVCKLVVTL